MAARKIPFKIYSTFFKQIYNSFINGLLPENAFPGLFNIAIKKGDSSKDKCQNSDKTNINNECRNKIQFCHVHVTMKSSRKIIACFKNRQILLSLFLRPWSQKNSNAVGQKQKYKYYKY